MGGPYWSGKDEGAWSVIKGEHDASEDPLLAAQREWVEETSSPPPAGELQPLGEVRLRSGKTVRAWAVKAPDLQPGTFVSNTFEMEWPPRSGKRQQFPEIDQAAWVALPQASVRLAAGQRPFLEALSALLAPD